MSGGPHIRAAVATPLLAAGERGAMQVCRVVVENPGVPVSAALHAGDASSELGQLPTGTSEHAIRLPEATVTVSTELVLSAGAHRATAVVSRAPVRRWECHVVHGSHHDIGYTDIPTNVLREHADHLDTVIEGCAATAGWPEESRFHWVAEQAWSVLYHLATRPEPRRKALLDLLREGRVEVTALYANETSELLGHEEQIRALYPSAALRRRYGVPVETAELNDIPGLSWGLVPVLAGAGIRWFAPGIQDYFGWGRVVRPHWDEVAVLPRDLPGAFRWRGQDGSEVLFWYGGRGIETVEMWSYEQTRDTLPGILAGMQERGYPWEIIRLKVLGGRRDNSPPDLRFSRIVREWNERWISPRLHLSTNARFFRRFESVARGLRVLEGELTATDYPLGATSRVRELAANRLAHETHAAAERLALWAAVEGDQVYPAEKLWEAGECILLGDEHTGGMAHPAGPAQEACWAWKTERIWRGAALSHDVQVKSAARLADRVRIEGDGYHVVVLNTLGWARTDLVRLVASPPEPAGSPMSWVGGLFLPLRAGARNLVVLPADLLEGPLALRDVETGDRVPVQVRMLPDPLAPRAAAPELWTLGRTEPYSPAGAPSARAHHYEIVFVARDVPAMGHRTYRLEQGGGVVEAAGALGAGPGYLESPAYRIGIDPASGAVTSVLDRRTGREWVDPSAPHPMAGVLTRGSDTGRIDVASLAAFGSPVVGCVFATYASRGGLPGCPEIRREITVYAELDRVDVAYAILKDATPLQEAHVAFPFALERPRFSYEGTNSVIRPGVDVLPGTTTDAFTAQHWVAVEDATGGVRWTSPEAPVVTLGGLTPSPVSQAHHAVSPPGWEGVRSAPLDPAGPGHLYSFLLTSNFRTNFQPSQVADVLASYSFTTGEPGTAEAHRFGWGRAAPLECVAVTGPRSGARAPTDAFLTLTGEAILLALKAAEDGDGIIVRLREPTGNARIVTLSFPRLEIRSACRTDLVERDGEPLEHGASTLSVWLAAHGIATVRLRDGRRYEVAGPLTWLA